MSVLDDILRQTRADLQARMSHLPLAELKQIVSGLPPVRSLKDALRSNRFKIIGEIKERSPSAGEMVPANVSKALRVYEDSPIIAAISVLTNGPYFGGSLDRLREVKRKGSKPVLRKDFIIDEYQVWEARAFGADAILLMAAIHSDEPSRLRRLYEAARSLGLQALVEIGMGQMSPAEQRDMVPPEAEIWGINSRKFDSSPLGLRMRISRSLGGLRRDFTTDASRHDSLRDYIPAGKIAVAESGIATPTEINSLSRLKYNAALIGTAFLKAPEGVKEVVKSFAAQIAQLRHTAPHQAQRVAYR
jgi:indole-3-glycerol phosphate synthase